MIERLSNELEPIVSSSRCVDWMDVFYTAYKNPLKYREIRFYNEAEEVVTSFFVRACLRDGKMCLEFREFSSETERRRYRAQFTGLIRDIEPRGFVVPPNPAW